MKRKVRELLKKGKLTPKERILLLVADKVNRDRYGKPLFNDSESLALYNWIPETPEEAQEWQAYWDGWERVVLAAADAHNVALTFQNRCLGAMLELAMIFWRKRDFDNKALQGWFPQFSNGEALEIVLDNSGLELDRLIYTFAFQSLSEALRKELVALYELVETDRSYLTQEELIAEWLIGRLPTGVLTNAIVEELCWQGEWDFSRYFASLQGYDIVRKWATNSGLYNQDNQAESEEAEQAELARQIADYAQRRGMQIRELLIHTLSKWLDNGLFVKEHQALVLSEKKEVFAEWLKAKEQAKQTIQALIDKRKLAIEDRVYEIRSIFDSGEKPLLRKTITLVTGASLYRSKLDFKFVCDYQLQAENLRGLGYIMLQLEEYDFLGDYALLLAFMDLFQRLSKVYEVDLVYRIKGWLDKCRQVVEAFNYEVNRIESDLQAAILRQYQIDYLITLLPSAIYVNLDKVKVERTDPHYSQALERLALYEQEFCRFFGRF